MCSSDLFDKAEIPGEVRALTQRILSEYDDGTESCPKQRFADRPRILVTGSPIGGASEKVIKCLEDNGAQVVVYENCGGAKSVDELLTPTRPTFTTLWPGATSISAARA